MPAQSLPSSSPWLSQVGLMPGALLPSLRLPGPLPETHQSPMDGWCRTPLSPENRWGQLRANAASSATEPQKGMEVPLILDASSSSQPSICHKH